LFFRELQIPIEMAVNGKEAIEKTIELYEKSSSLSMILMVDICP